jgi:hypothetical protein
MTDPGKMMWDTPGLLYGRNQAEVKYRIDGDVLEVIGARWTRVR